MTILCISCPQELPEEHEAAVNHFKDRNVPAEFVNGIHAETFGILAWRPYRKDFPRLGLLTEMAQTGLSLSHYMAWNICLFGDDSEYLILEADARFSENWKERLSKAIEDAPDDWDIILIGNSHTFDKPSQNIKGEVFEVKYPFCTHAYLVRAKAIPKLIELCRDAAMHIDIALIDKAYPSLRVYTILPRICEQGGRELPV